MAKTTGLAPAAIAVLLGCSALTAPAQAGWFSSDSKDDAAKASKTAVVTSDKVAPAQTLDDSIRQAQLLRLAGKYDDAVRQLSQIMLVAADDPRVVSEYGKTLAAMGRAPEAVNFLTRAEQLSPNDWTVYSALGVAQDEVGDQNAARIAYEHALSLKPGEPSVLNNYALSRMLAKDPETARKLVARAEIAGGASDPKIARNIAMIRSLAPDAPAAPSFAVNTPAPAPTSHVGVAALAPAAPNQTQPFVHVAAQTAMTAPRPLAPASGVIDVAPQPMVPAPAGVVMQRVPTDPLAGPVASHAPRPLAPPKADKALAHEDSVRPVPAPRPDPKLAQAKPADSKANAQAQAATQANDLEAKAEAIARQLAAKPGAIAQAKAEANKDAKADAAKAAPAPHVLPPAPAKVAAKPEGKAEIKTAAAKPGDAGKEKAGAKAAAAKDSVPSLRLSANAY